MILQRSTRKITQGAELRYTYGVEHGPVVDVAITTLEVVGIDELHEAILQYGGLAMGWNSHELPQRCGGLPLPTLEGYWQVHVLLKRNIHILHGASAGNHCIPAWVYQHALLAECSDQSQMHKSPIQCPCLLLHWS